MTSSTSFGSAHGSGEYAPMPPVLGPSSPSSARLKSCAGWSGRTVTPSVMAKRETSGPSRNSSMTTRSQASACCAGRGEVLGDDDALAGRESVVLDDVRGAEGVEGLVHLLGGRADVAAGGGDPGRRPSRPWRRPWSPPAARPPRRGRSTGMPARAHGVGDPGDERGLRADDDQVGAELGGERARRPRRRGRRPGAARRPRAMPALPGAQ